MVVTNKANLKNVATKGFDDTRKLNLNYGALLDEFARALNLEPVGPCIQFIVSY